MLNLLKLIPTKLLTQTAGSLANQKLPAPLLQKFIQFYCKIYSINLSESQGKLTSFKTFNEFFTRDIDFAKRKIDNAKNSIISPVDGILIGFDKIHKNKLYSTKGVEFKRIVRRKKRKNFEANGSYISYLILNRWIFGVIYCPKNLPLLQKFIQFYCKIYSMKNDEQFKRIPRQVNLF